MSLVLWRTSAVSSRLTQEEDQTSEVPIDKSARAGILIHVSVIQESTRMQSVHRHHPLAVTAIVRKANMQVVRVPQHAATVRLVSVQHPAATVSPLHYQVVPLENAQRASVLIHLVVTQGNTPL